ncbi:GNAT family N-acetyltransferase [Chryseobacterium sp. MMS23-Vi53]|uniref:GNAT family N-acetyltransferase n=1 Tax=Chryseobacterium sp. MMS23-Vi53 TaxID=3386644 RepID=UPI0039ECDBEA
MSFNLQYRKATENDIEFLIDLREKTMSEHYISSNLPATREVHTQRVLYEYDNAKIIIFNDESVGLLKVSRNNETIYIIQLQIDPSLQGKGIGKFILKDMLEEAENTGKTVTLSVLKTNKAQHLYSSLGFVIIDENEHSYFMEFSK